MAGHAVALCGDVPSAGIKFREGAVCTSTLCGKRAESAGDAARKPLAFAQFVNAFTCSSTVTRCGYKLFE